MLSGILPQEGKDLALEHFQIDVIHRHPGPETLGQPGGLEANFALRA
jgi:hypothetical protein